MMRKTDNWLIMTILQEPRHLPETEKIKNKYNQVMINAS